MVTVPDNEETTDLKPDPQAVKAAATREQISPTSQHEKSFRTRSKSLSSSSVRPRQTLTVNSAAQEFIPPLPNDDATEAVKVRSWEMILEHSIKAIVAIKANDVRSFDTEVSGMSLSFCEIIGKGRVKEQSKNRKRIPKFEWNYL